MPNATKVTHVLVSAYGACGVYVHALGLAQKTKLRLRQSALCHLLVILYSF